MRGGSLLWARFTSSISGVEIRGPSWRVSGAAAGSALSVSVSIVLHDGDPDPSWGCLDPDPVPRHKHRYANRPSGSLTRMHSGDGSRRCFDPTLLGLKSSFFTSSHLGMAIPLGETGGV